MAVLRIVRPGMLTTVQDLGRWGFQAMGVPVSGAMDAYSHRLANRLVGNRESDATLEATLMGPEIAFEGATAFAVTGAALNLTLDGETVEMNRRHEARAGAVLKCGDRLRGARSYIGVSGGIDVPPVLGSRATHLLTHMGGVEGRALRAGDRLRTGIDDSSGEVPDRRQARGSPLPLPLGGSRLRVVAGDPALLGYLVSQRFRVSPRSDRMGYRLEGEAIGPAPTGEGISSGVATGAVQVPPSGQPILLMADRATTGGYLIGGTVIAADLPVAGQLAPGDWVEFEPCSLEAADRALRAREAAGRG